MPIIQKISLYDIENHESPSKSNKESSSNVQDQPMGSSSTSTPTSDICQHKGQCSQNARQVKTILWPPPSLLTRLSSKRIGQELANKIRSKSKAATSSLSGSLSKRANRQLSNPVVHSKSSQEIELNSIKIEKEDMDQCSATRDFSETGYEGSQKSTSDQISIIKSELDVVVKEEAVDIDETPVIQQSWQDFDHLEHIKQENELILESDEIQSDNNSNAEDVERNCPIGKSFCEETIEDIGPANHHDDLNLTNGNSNSRKSEMIEENNSLSYDDDEEILDDKFGFLCTKRKYSSKTVRNSKRKEENLIDSSQDSEDTDESPAKRQKLDNTSPKSPDTIIPYDCNISINSDQTEPNSTESLPKSVNNVSNFTATEIINSFPKGITVKKSRRQVACKSTSSVSKNVNSFRIDNSNLTGNQNFTSPDGNHENISTTKIKEEPSEDQCEENECSEPKILNSTENAEKLAQKTNEKSRLKPANSDLNISRNSKSDSLVFGDSSEILESLSPKIQNDTNNHQTSPTSHHENINEVKIKEEKFDDDEINTETKTITGLNLSGSSQLPSNQKIKEELDDYLAAGPSGLNMSSLTASAHKESVLSTKVMTIPASDANKPRKIIVIKKVLPPGAPRPQAGQIVRKMSLADFKKLGVNNSIENVTNSSSTAVDSKESIENIDAGNARFIVKSIPDQLSSTIKSEATSPSSHTISNAMLLGSSPKPSIGSTVVTFPKTNTKIVVNKQNPIFRCQKCNLFFTSQMKYNDHLEEHKAKEAVDKLSRLENFQKLNQYQCSQCTARFPNLDRLAVHENRHKTEFVCNHCGKKFLLLYRYKEHVMIHEGKRAKYKR